MQLYVRISLTLVAALQFSCNKTDPEPKSGNPDTAAAERKHPVKVIADFGPVRFVQPDVAFREATLIPNQTPMKVWFYKPKDHAENLPVVIVPPAGSTLYHGIGLQEGNHESHYDFVRAGFAVIAFEIDGKIINRETTTDAAMLSAAKRFREAQAGVVNMKAALDYVLAKLPELDAGNVFISGHSSAGTLALVAAGHEPRIQGCVAYAPVTDVPVMLAEVSAFLDKDIPGFADFLRSTSPNQHADKLKCPVYLFHARDDEVVPVAQTIAFASQLKRTNSKVELKTVDVGGHGDAVFNVGIPESIAWMKKQINNKHRE